ncbi:WG repeat-containing protein [Galbibacter sp. PAP.153]|uniref:WG repeat-containing protein n=1 Tax=Galbibacter sp. PAP.153 TaxID=3104623 RepID=UPI003008F89E
MILQVIFLLSRDIGASIMAGVILAIFLMLFQYISNKRKERVVNLNNQHKQEEQHTMPIDSKSSLLNLKKKGIISEVEYSTKVNIIEESKFEHVLKETKEYRQLKELLNSNILTKEEFEKKIDLLKNTIKRKNEREEHIRSLKFNQIGDFIEGLAKVWDENENYGFIDMSDNLIIPCQYEYAEDFSEGVAVVRKNGKFGYIDEEGNVIIPIEYDDARSFYNGITKVKLYNRFIFINKEGDEITLNKEQKQAFEDRNIINFETTYIKSGFSLKMGSYDEFIIENNEKGLEFTIYKNILNEKYYMYMKNNEILLFPNKRTCIKYISENLVN